MTTLIHQHVEACRQGSNLRAVCRVHSGWVVFGEAQFVRGYSLLLPDPVVPNLNQLEGAARGIFLEEMARVGDALLELTGAARINYEILGNLEQALHAHILPRYLDEPETLRTRPVWFYDWGAGPAFDLERDRPLMDALRERLLELKIAL